ncbi:DnaJ family domain-containing protein [Glutamicibacter arilaitensis]|uniref:DnaJ family domain-containing protein n=1 Tax=Glutamicibacter arilaitensis TaxID=256701 RepID=UPI00384D8958
MSSKPEKSAQNAALNAARYQMATNSDVPVPVDKYAEQTGKPSVTGPARTPLQYHAQDEAWEVANSVLDGAFARGEFDNLPLSGKNIDHITSSTDPDWWLKSMMHREQLSGLGPPALTLRVEDEQLQQTLDRLPTAAAVREHLTDFNQRIVEARRQLLGGPAVVTMLRDVEAEVLAWTARRSIQVVEPIRPASTPRRRWWSRRK